MGPEERRARLARRHHLAPGTAAAGVADAARDLVGLHATDPSSVFLAARARMLDPTVGAIEDALYTERTLVRMLGMRRTMFVVPTELVAVVHAACTAAIATRERARLVQHLEEVAIPAGDGAAWLRSVEEATVLALARRGQATAAELSADVADLKLRIVFGVGTKWEGRQAACSRVLFVLAADGRIVRGRPRGSWTSSQYRWAPAGAWLPRQPEEITTADARVVLVRRWLASFGPATIADVGWWTGLTMGQVKAALARIGPAEVDLGDAPGVVLAGDLDPTPRSPPWAALLPALDPTMMGWKERRWYLGDHGPALFDRSGNAGPTVWWDGRVVGGWAQRKDGEIAVRLLEDVGSDAAAAVGVESERLTLFLGDVRVTPRFRTPLERELTA